MRTKFLSAAVAVILHPATETKMIRPGTLGENAMSHTDRVFALIAVAVVLTMTIGLWLTNLL